MLGGGNLDKSFDIADMSIVEKNFAKAFDEDKPSKNITIEMLRHRVPLHLGGMSDPFQSKEFLIKNTYNLLELTKKYNYPMLISTKQSHLPDEYFDVLDPNIHAFQISLMGYDEEFINKFEYNTPSPSERIEFIKQLESKGFWVGIRIQPLIDAGQAIKVVENLSDIVDYITIEHIKIGNDNSHKKQMFIDMNLNPNDFVSCGREYEFKTEIKRKNIELLKSISKCPMGCGDNDLHELSDSHNCCGIDTINDNFSHWIKYNAMYINQTGDRNNWSPCNNCSQCFNSECRIKGATFKDYVDEYMNEPKKVGICKVKIK